MEEDERILNVADKLLYYIESHKIKNAMFLKKFIYTHNFDEEDMKNMKDVFNKYDEMNVYNCVLFYNEGIIKDKNDLLKKIKGVD